MTTRGDARRRRLDWALGVALVAATVLAYLPAIEGGFLWDDEQYVTGNAAVRSSDGLRRIWLQPWASPQYYPLTLSSFWLEHRLFGLHPAGYHLTNVLLHAAAALLLVRLLRRLAVPSTWLAAAVFALHPVHVESVAWITERKNVLSGVFFFLSLLAWLRFAPPDGERRGPSRAWVLAFVWFCCGLLSKTVTSVMPAVALLLLWWKRGRIRWKDAVPLLPFLACGIAAGSLTGWLEKHRVGAWGPDWDLSWVERILVAGRAVWFYLAKLVWPYPLMFVYPRWEAGTAPLVPALFPLAAIGVVLALWALRGRIGRAPLTAALYFAGVLVPALSFVNVFPMLYSFVADHFQYLASVGPIAAAAAGIAVVSSRPAARRVVPVLAVIWVGALVFATRERAHVFADVETLYRDTIAKNPAAWMARGNLASLLHTRAREEDLPDEEQAHLLSEAEREYRATLALRPDNLPARMNLAAMLEARGDPDAAEREYRAAIDPPNRYPPGSRGFLQRGDPWFHYGRFLEAHGRRTEAGSAYRRATEINPAFDLALSALGRVLADDGRASEARDVIERALAVNPRLVPALVNLGSIRAAEGRIDDALELFQRAIAVDPGFALAYSNLGSALLRKGELERAAVALHRALEIDPGLTSARSDLDECMRGLMGPPAAR